MEEHVDEVPPSLPLMIELPSGGEVRLKDPESLRGAEYKRLRMARRAYELDSNKLGQMYETAAALLVVDWRIPGLPNLPLPGSDEGLDGKITDLLHWRDCHVLNEALSPAILMVTEGRAHPPVRPSSG